MKRFLSLSILLASACYFVGAVYAQTGYSIQLAAYSSPATVRHFEALRQPVQEVKIDASTYLYVIDGFVSYADADKVRKMAVGKGFPDAIALKTSSSRTPALKVKPYTGIKEGDPVPQLASPGNAATAATATPPPTAATGTYSTTTAPTKTAPATTTYSSTAPPPAATTYSSTTPPPTATYSSQPQTPPPATTYSSGGSSKPTTPPTATYSSAPTTPAPATAATPAKPTKPATPKADPYGNDRTYDYDVNYGGGDTGGTTRGGGGGGDLSSLSGVNYDQNFDVTETTVRALVSKGSVTSESVRAAEVTENTNVAFFDYDKAVLRTNTERELSRMISKMQGNVAYVLEIRAHTDAVGTDMYNNELSERRAKAAMIFVLGKGIPVSRVNFRSFGESRPLASNTTPDGGDNAMGRQINRRVELVLKDFDGRIIDAVTMP